MEIITWTRVERDGGESLRRGAVWSPAPSAPGRLTHWVIRLPDDPGQNVDVLSWADLALVVTVTKRHRSEGGRGRYFDPGERYEDDVATALAGRGEWVRPGWLTRAEAGRSASPWRRWLGPVGPLPAGVYKALSGVGEC